jgi:uncharacterized protein (DUF1015 family)
MVGSAGVALLKPLRALRYDVEAAGPLDDLVAPPYDVVTPEVRERLLSASAYNCVRLIRPNSPNEAARTLKDWRKRGILMREDAAAAWLLEEEFTGPDGVRRTRRALVARVRLHPYEDGIVLPHERTFPGPKRRRLRLLRAARTKLSPILLLHEGSPPAPPPARPPDLEATLAGASSRLWRIDAPSALADALARVRPRLLIADGHHRYETALRFHQEDGSEETGYVLAALVSRDDPGLVVFPTHRLARGSPPDLDGRFRVTVLEGSLRKAVERLDRVPRDRPAFVVLKRGGAFLAESGELSPAATVALDTAAVDALPLEGVSFTASVGEAERAVSTGAASAAFLVRSPTVEEIEAVALAGETMPPKTTYFFPKLTSGLLFAPFDE